MWAGGISNGFSVKEVYFEEIKGGKK